MSKEKMGEINPRLSYEYEQKILSMINPWINENTKKLMVEYALTPEEHLSALNKIREYCFRGKSPSAYPTCYLVISQTGGGKSGLTAKILSNNKNIVVIDSDAFKAFNPHSAEIQDKYPDKFGSLTGPDAYMHRDEVYQEAIANGYDILIEIAPSPNDMYFNVNFEELLAAGYIIDANILAVSLANSLLSIHERYEGQLESGMKNAKLTDFPRAMGSYEAVESVVRDLIAREDVLLSIYKRGNTINENKIPLPEFITSDKSVAMESFKMARDADYLSILSMISERIKAIRSKMDERKASTEQRGAFNSVVEKIEEMGRKKN